MTSHDSESVDARWSSVALLAGALFVATAFYVYPLFLDIPLLDPDEGIHAVIAQEMVERGDYVTPHFLGEPFFDKPILYFWAEAASLNVLGMNEAGVRLPGLLFALLGNLSTALLGWHLFGRRTGILAGFIHATMFLPLAVSQAGLHDIAHVLWTNLALLFFWLGSQQAAWWPMLRRYATAGAFLGLAILTKGLLGVALVGLTVGLFLLISRRITVRAAAALAISLGVAIAVASPWYILVSMQNPGYLYYYFVERHLLGYVTVQQTHGHAPWWYYLPVLIGGGLPWVIDLPAAALRSGQGSVNATDCSRSSATAFVWVWLIGNILFLSIAHSKLLTYALPVFPAIAILSAENWSALIAGRVGESVRKWFRRTVTLSCLCGPIILPLSMKLLSTKFDVAVSPLAWVVIGGLSIAAVTPWWFFRQNRIVESLAAAVLFQVGLFLLIMTIFMPPIGQSFSARELAVQFNSHGHLPRHVFVVGERLGSIIFYLNPKIRHDLYSHQIDVLSRDDAEQLAELPDDSTLAMPLSSSERLPAVARLPRHKVGHYRVYDGHHH